MSIEKSYSVTLKVATSETGSFESIRILKGRSKLPDETLACVNKVLQESLIPSEPVRTTVAIGDDAEQKIFNHLLYISSLNMDFDVFDTSSSTGHGDMAVHHQGKHICIEVKCYTKPVPMKEIDKYHRSLDLAEYDAGIMIQMERCGYAREAKLRSPIDIKMYNGKPTAYLTGVSPDMLYPIINALIVQIELCDETTDEELELKRKALLSINEKITDLRGCIDSQKKTITKMEAAVDAIAKLSLC